MAQIDQIKEILNNLRLYFSITSVIFLTLAVGLIGMYKKDEINDLFWVGISTLFVIFVIFLIVILKIRNKTKKIGGL